MEEREETVDVVAGDGGGDDDDARSDVSMNLDWSYTMLDHNFAYLRVSFVDEDRRNRSHPQPHRYLQAY